MATASTAKNDLGLTEENGLAIKKAAFLAQAAAGVLVLAGAVGIVGGIVVLFLGAGFWNSAWIVIQGGITALMGLVLLAVSGDLGYMASVPTFSKVHLKNAGENLRYHFKLLLNLAVLLALVLALRLFW
jgi:hypothetical protein